MRAKNNKKFKDLTEEDKELIINTYNQRDDISWEKRAAKLGEMFGASERTIRKWVSEKLGLKENNFENNQLQSETIKSKKGST